MLNKKKETKKQETIKNIIEILDNTESPDQELTTQLMTEINRSNNGLNSFDVKCNFIELTEELLFNQRDNKNRAYLLTIRSKALQS